MPSLPGYGLSVPLRTTGIDVLRVAELWKTLMTEVLGFARFGAQGGDWGAIVTALARPRPPGAADRRLPRPSRSSPGWWAAGSRRRTSTRPTRQWMLERMKEARPLIEAHVAVHRRDPQTFAYAMADSPTGLGAWLWHRRHLWCDGDALEVFGRDFLCTLSSLYWFNTSFASSIRLYAEQFGKKPRARARPRAHHRGARPGSPSSPRS